jgi:hypothetical protein
MVKYIEGFENYLVSETGEIFSAKTNKKRKTSLTNCGYETVVLFNENGRKSRTVHRLVAKAFICNDDKLKNQVNHIDGNKTNNNVSNLEWVTMSENMLHSYNELSRKPSICSKLFRYSKDGLTLIESFESVAECCRKYNFNSYNIYRVINGGRKSAYNSQWKIIHSRK